MDCKQQRIVLLLLFTLAVAAQFESLLAQFDYPTATVPTRWINGPNIPHTISYPDGTTIKALLLRSPEKPAFFGPSFATGFYCRSSTPSSTPCRSNFLFGVFIVYTNSGGGITNVMQGIPQLVWSANRGRPVGENAILELSLTDGLTLKDADGSFVWSSGNGGSLMGLQDLTIFHNGNLQLMIRPGSAAWSSFDSPTDALLPGQILGAEKSIKANLSSTAYTQEGPYFITAKSFGFIAYFASGFRPPQPYYMFQASPTAADGITSMIFQNGSFSFQGDNGVIKSIALPTGPSAQYLRLESDSGLRLFQWKDDSNGWRSVANLINSKTLSQRSSA